MKNAQLIIRDSKELGYDIWQTCDCENWSANTWNTAVKTLSEAMQNVYNAIDKGDDVAAWDLNSLGDAINLLNALEITMK